MKRLFILFSLYSLISLGQDYYPSNTGVKTSQNTRLAFTGAKIYVSPTKVLENATLLINNGKVEQVGTGISIPKQAQQINISGKTIYPSFIDAYSTFGIKTPKSAKRDYKPQYDAGRKGYYWNDHIRPETDATTLFSYDKKKAEDLLKAGFGVVNTHQEDGIMQGNGVLVALQDKSANAQIILDNASANFLSFKKSKQSNQAYPTSLMGAMALLRQTYLDTQWYAKGNAKNTDLALKAVNKKKQNPQIFNAGSYLNALRADKIGDEFGIQYTILGGGNEYERIDDIKQTNADFIIPINFRKPYDVSDPFYANRISLHDMRRWNQEPTNPSVLAKNGIRFAITPYGLKSVNDFQGNLQKAIENGLSKTKALESLTTVPASILKNDKIGNLNKGSYANFLITSGDIFDKNTTLYENWVLGNKNSINPIDVTDLSGTYDVSVDGKTYELTITGKSAAQKGTLKLGDEKVTSNFSFKDNWLQIAINNDDNFTRLTTKVTDKNNIQGKATDSFGNESYWSATKKTTRKEDDKKTSDKKTNEIVSVTYPNVGFGNANLPKQETILIKNATLWTSEKQYPVLENTDILLKNGKISKIGKNLSAGGAKTIDGTGKYVTAGIVDEHSHIATSAVNESGHNCSAEVSIEDVINPDDVNIYRNLAGGVTSIQVLHGSANPIGGRSAILKLKWGENAKNLIYKNTPKFIKFALGENVKQSNWGSFNTIRFPQTRMGVEQVYMDYFNRAKEYEKAKKLGNYRKDIELETILEIINKERFISCHSYVQSEINMLMKVAEKFNFNINTFTHILEGYKVADKMKKHGAGGSTFADWWAYKFEVNDAIPYNAAIMHNQGITVAINSDDAEMSRRLNHEAAKLIKYGGMSELDAWNTITINPAKLLHLDKRSGSLKEGKDADVVIWSDNPLSVYAKVEQTIIDGTIYFDRVQDKQKRANIKAEKAKLIDMMLKEKLAGAKTQTPTKTEHKLFHCDTE